MIRHDDMARDRPAGSTARISRRAAVGGLIAMVGLGHARIGRAEGPKKGELERKLRSIRAKFERGQKDLDAQVNGAFDGLMKRVDADPQFTEGTKSDKKAALAEARAQFGSTGQMPTEAAFDLIARDYVVAFGKLLEQSGLDAGRISEAARRYPSVSAAATGFRGELQRRGAALGQFRDGDRFRGTMFRPKMNAIPYHVQIFKVGHGGSFGGHVEDNPGVAGNWSYDIDGQSQAGAFKFRLTRSLRGSFSFVEAQGYLYGDRLFARVEQLVGEAPRPGTLVDIALKRFG